MKKVILFFVAALATRAVCAQSVGIGGAFVPDPGSVLEIKAPNGNQGVLLPCMDASAIQLITNN